MVMALCSPASGRFEHDARFLTVLECMYRRAIQASGGSDAFTRSCYVGLAIVLAKQDKWNDAQRMMEFVISTTGKYSQYMDAYKEALRAIRAHRQPELEAQLY